MSRAELADDTPEPLANFVAGRLARAIELGELRPGARLVEADIAARFGVSRAPVREALRLLLLDELVEQRPRRGTVVAMLSPDEISEIVEVRSALYAAVVRLFVRRSSPAELDELATLFKITARLSRDAAVTPAQFVEATQASSAFIVARCDNRRLQTMFGKLNRQSYRHYAQLAHGTLANRQHLVRFTTELLALARAGDAEAASMCAWRLHEANHAAARAAIAAQARRSPP
jgi:DNA-binding GntR family transcriptional regulator